MVSATGLHGLSCRKNPGRHQRHNLLNEIIHRAVVKTDTPASREPHGLCPPGDKRPDGATLVPWSRGLCLAWDATCPDTFSQSHVASCSVTAGAAAASAESAKITKYSDILPTFTFVPVAIETSGVWGQEGLSLVNEIGARLSRLHHDSRHAVFLRQRLSIAIQRGNAICIRSTFRSDNTSQLTV